MNINWYGLNCVRVQENGVALLFDPPAENSGINLPKLQNDIVLYSGGKSTGKDKVFVVDSPGEYEVKGAFVYGIPSGREAKREKLIFLTEIDGIRLAHLGGLDNPKLTANQLEQLQGIDVLLVPVGGGDSLTSKQAIEIINQLEPRVIIPINYQVPKIKAKLETLDTFKKEVGASFESTDKLKLSKKDLPEEDAKFIVVELSR